MDHKSQKDTIKQDAGRCLTSEPEQYKNKHLNDHLQPVSFIHLLKHFIRDHTNPGHSIILNIIIKRSIFSSYNDRFVQKKIFSMFGQFSYLVAFVSYIRVQKEKYFDLFQVEKESAGSIFRILKVIQKIIIEDISLQSKLQDFVTLKIGH